MGPSRHPPITQAEWDQLESLMPEREVSARKRLAEYLGTSAKDELHLKRKWRTSLGRTVFTFTLVHAGLPVHDASWNIVYERYGEVRLPTARSNFGANELADVIVVPQYSAAAVRKVLFREIHNLKRVDVLSMYLVAYRDTTSDAPVRIRLEYHARLFVHKGGREQVSAATVAAATGRILWETPESRDDLSCE